MAKRFCALSLPDSNLFPHKIMKRGTEPQDLPIGIVLSEKNKEILVAARELEEVLGRHNLTFADFACAFYDKGQNWCVDLAVCNSQAFEDREVNLKATLERLSDDEKRLLKEHFQDTSE